MCTCAARADPPPQSACALRPCLPASPQIHLNPRIIDCPFVVDLSLPDSHAAGSGAADAPAGLADAAAGGASQAPGGSPAVSSGPVTGNMYSLGSRSLLVPLAKGEDGSMRVQVRVGGRCTERHAAAAGPGP